MIRQEGGKYVVYSESGKRFGSYSSEKDAKRRLAQMEMFKHMKKTAAAPKLKNFFAAEPSCIVHGAGKQCVYGKAPNFAKKAMAELPRTFAVIARELEAAGAGLKNVRKAINLSDDTKALTMYMKKEKALLNKVTRLKSEIKN